MSSSNEQLNESVEQLLGGSIRRVLQENLGIDGEQVGKPSMKQGKQQNKGNAEPISGPSIHQSTVVYQDHDSEESDREEVHCIKPIARKRQPKESKEKKFRKRLNT